MFDGAAPYNNDKLAASGQAMKTNLNFGEATRLLDISLSAYVDLYTSLEKLVEVKGTIGEATERGVFEDIVGEELTHMMRSWPEFHSSYLRLCTTFIKHGVGFLGLFWVAAAPLPLRPVLALIEVISYFVLPVSHSIPESAALVIDTDAVGFRSRWNGLEEGLDICTRAARTRGLAEIVRAISPSFARQ